VDEWKLVREGIDQYEKAVAGRLRGIIAARGSWFDLALSDGWVETGLASGVPDEAAELVSIVGRAQRIRPAAVAELLSRYVGVGGDWPNRLSWVVGMADLTLDRQFHEFVLRAIAAGDLDNIQPFAANGTFWDEAYPLARARPAWAAEFARCYLDRHVARSSTGIAKESLDDIPEPLDHGFFSTIAANAPQPYIENLLPWIIGIAEQTTRDGSGHRYDWFSARWPGKPLKLSDALMGGLDDAFRALGEAGEGLGKWRDQLAAAKSETANFALLRLGRAALGDEATAITRLLIEQPERLQAGNFSDSHWATREFLVAAVPGLPSDVGAELQATIRDYHPAWERSAAGKADYGHAQWELLSAFPESSLTDESRRRMGELRRKFGTNDPAPPRGIEVSYVGSPISEEAAGRMTDDQWLRALRKYAGDAIRWDRPMSRAGGIHQLGQTLYAHTVAEPRRFAALALRFPDDLPHPYMDDVLRGLAEAKIDVPLDEIAAVCIRAHRLPGRPSGRGIADLIGKRAHEAISSELLDVVAWYAANAADPDSPRRPISGEGMTEADLIESHALNSDRSRAMLAVADLIRGDPSRLQSLRAAIEAGVSDPVDAVRAATAEALLVCLRHDPEFVEVSLRALMGSMPDALLASRAVAALIAHFVRTNFAGWRDVLDRMLASKDVKVNRFGAAIAAVASLETPEAVSYVDGLLAGTEPERLGIADVASANVSSKKRGAAAQKWASLLFADPSPEVRREAGQAVSSLPPESLGDHQSLIRAFVTSPAFEDNPGLFFHHLAESASLPGDLALLACERYIQVARGAAGDIRTAASASAGDVSRVAVRAYDHGKDLVRERALDIIDNLLKVAAYGIGPAIDKYER
jgi:hypothetical protein